MIGITGNRNWMAITLLATAPWAAWWLYGRLSRRRRGGRVLLAAAPVALPTIYLMYWCFSRAAWLALVGYVLLAGFHRLSGLRRRAGYVSVLVGLAVVLAVVGRERLHDAYLADVRIPIYRSVARLIADSPVLGVGAGQLTKHVTPYLLGSGYHRRLVAAEQMLHPHNEILNIAANIGIVPTLAWALLLLPLLGDHRKESAVVRLAHFSALVILTHSMLDKPFVQPPSDVVALFCIGVCWQRRVLGLRLPEAGDRRVLAVWCAGAALVAAGGVALAQRDVRAGWAHRCAAVAAAAGRYDQAVRWYARMAEIDPGRIQGYYSAGGYAIERLLNPELAWRYLARAYAMDPNYAQINRFIGEALGTRGDHYEALRYFRRHVELLPHSTSARQSLYTSLFMTRKFDQLPHVDAALRRLYREKTDLAFPHDTARPWAERWLAAVRRGRPLAARVAATALTRRLALQFPDLSLGPVSGDLAWPPAFVWAKFSASDVAYWRSVVLRFDLAGKLPPAAAPAAARLHAVSDLIAGHVTVDPAMAFAAPAELWDEGCGSPLAIACLGAWLLSGDVPAWVVDVAGTPLAALPAATGLVAVDLTAGGAVTSMAWPGHHAVQQVYLPQQFLLKNQILGVVIRHVLGTEAPRFDEIPFLALRRTIGSYPDCPGTPGPEDLTHTCVQAPFMAVFNDLRQPAEP